MKQADVLIIGGGISGLMSAWYLREAGHQVTVLERHVCGREASWAGGGILSPMYPWRYPDAVNVLARHSQPQFESLSAELTRLTGIDPEYSPCGMLMLDSEDWEVAQRWCARWGYALEILTDRELALLEPRLQTERRLGLWMPQIASLRNPRLMKALKQALLLRGVTIHEHTPVRAVEGEKGIVETPQGAWQAQVVVLAAGAWSGALLPRLTIQPVKGQMIAFEAPAGFLRRMVMEDGRYLIPRRDGLVVVGSTLEAGTFDKTPTVSVRDDLVAFALSHYPELEMFPVAYHWAGIRPGRADSVPLIGPVPGQSRLWVNAGHFRNGVVTSIASAQLLTALVQGEPTPFDAAPYAVQSAP